MGGSEWLNILDNLERRADGRKGRFSTSEHASIESADTPSLAKTLPPIARSVDRRSNRPLGA